MPENNPLFESLRRDIYRDYDVDATIAPADEMFRFTREREFGDWDRALVKYVHDGRRVAWPLLDLAGAFFPDLSQVKVLDFASGYGRVTRHLVHEIPRQNITVSDIMAEAVAFQERQFGVRGIVSVTDPAEFVCDDRFDLIFVTSLFTHLPRDRFAGWLRRLIQLLTGQGVMVISVHDRSLLEKKTDEPLLFKPKSESAILSPTEYGTAWVSESFIREIVAGADNSASCARLPRALNNFHDFYVIARGGREADLRYDAGPEGHVEEAAIEADALRCKGWIRQIAPWYRAERAEVWWAGERVAATTELVDRDDVAEHFADDRARRSGFEFRIPLARHRSFLDPFFVVGYSSNNRSNLLHAGSVDSLLYKMLRDALIDPWNPFAAPISDVGFAVALRERVKVLEQRMATLDRLGLGLVRRIRRFARRATR